MKNRNSIAVLFFSFWVVTSCAFNKPPTKGEYLAIKEGQKSLVLLKVTGEITGESAIDAFSSFAADENFNIAVGDFETGGALKRIENQKFLSAKTRKQGWIYFILEPGIYYLGFQGPRWTDVFTYEAQWENVQRYRIDIQPDSPVVYIGTMHLQCRSAWNLLGVKNCAHIYSQVVKNEEVLAQKVASENLKTTDRPKTVLMQLHTEKTLIFRTPEPQN